VEPSSGILDVVARLMPSIQGLGAGGTLLLILIGGYRQWWCWGWQLRKMEEERDFYRDGLLRALKVAENTTEAARHKGKP
jgi:hypothetical protein